MIRSTTNAMIQIGRARRGARFLAKCQTSVTSPLRMDDCLVNAELLQGSPARQVVSSRGAAFIPPSAMRPAAIEVPGSAVFVSPDQAFDVPQCGAAVSRAPQQYRHPLDRPRGLGMAIRAEIGDIDENRTIALRSFDAPAPQPIYQPMATTTPAGTVDPANPNTILTTYTAGTAVASIPVSGSQLTPAANSVASSLFMGPVQLGAFTLDKTTLWLGAAALVLLMGGRR